jgi:hypothetical protein
MNNNNSCGKYFESKMDIFARLIKVNEEFLSGVDDWESYDNHLSKRDDLIGELKELDDNYGQEIISSCSKEQRDELDNSLNLIIALDKDIASSMEKIRLETLDTMKSTTMTKKITDYAYGEPIEQSGRLLDYKK